MKIYGKQVVKIVRIKIRFSRRMTQVILICYRLMADDFAAFFKGLVTSP